MPVTVFLFVLGTLLRAARGRAAAGRVAAAARRDDDRVPGRTRHRRAARRHAVRLGRRAGDRVLRAAVERHVDDRANAVARRQRRARRDPRVDGVRPAHRTAADGLVQPRCGRVDFAFDARVAARAADRQRRGRRAARAALRRLTARPLCDADRCNRRRRAAGVRARHDGRHAAIDHRRAAPRADRDRPRVRRQRGLPGDRVRPRPATSVRGSMSR